METHEPRPDQEGFGEASLGEAQSSDPPADPEMLEDLGDDDLEDQDAEASLTADLLEDDDLRDQAEGDDY